MANIFPRQKLKQLASKIPTNEIVEKVEIVKRWLEDYETGTLKTDKETSREQAYNQDFFIKILGYDEKPSSPYSFEPKPSTSQGELPDAIVGHLTQSAFTFADQKVSAVVELKGAAVGLDKPQKREGNMSPVQQGFKYKPKYKYCPFVIVSNFYEFRLYQDNQLDYEVWTLHDLCSEEDEFINFKSFYLLLSKANFVPNNGEGKSATEELLTDIRTEQEEIGKDFYKVYKEARLELLRTMWRNNDRVKTDIDFGIEKAQKIIDRVVFACFAEDRGLLPDDTLRRLIKNSDESWGTLWASLKGFFEAIDKGSEKLEIPVGYNGGLFAEDTELNSLIIEDKPLRALAELSNYDFAEQLSVQILGHIFEQSITDLEDIKEKAENYVKGEALDSDSENKSKPKSKRKKDGIFYTPDYIVKYIVDSSLGEYLRNAEDRFKTEAGLNAEIIDKTYLAREKKAYGRYQDFLKNVKVCDPACGSGAFLVQVFDFLLQENKRVAEILDSLFNQDEFITDILHNNIYGVDLNEESVEISKLSLWLKSAKKGKPRTSLSNNIKCGNSLIAEEEIAGERAFSWHQAFPEIFKQGGFDVIIGNPPYVQLSEKEDIDEKTKQYLISRYRSSMGRLNTFGFFIALASDITKTSGMVSFIVPNTLLTQSYYSGLRERLLKECKVLQLVNFLELPFADAVVENIIVTFSKEKVDEYEINIFDSRINSFMYNRSISSKQFLGSTNFSFNIFYDESADLICKKMQSVGIKLGEIAEVNQAIALKGSREAWVGKVSNPGFKKVLVGGKNIDRYHIEWSGEYLDHKPEAIHSCNRTDIFESEKKLFFRRVSNRLIAAIDNEQLYGLHTLVVINLRSDFRNRYTPEFILALFNSKLLEFYFRSNFRSPKTVFSEIGAQDVRELPISLTEIESQNVFVELVEQMNSKTKEFHDLNDRFLHLLKVEYQIEKLPKKLDKWYELDFSDFVKTLKLKLSISQKDELLELFEKYLPEILKVKTQIDALDKEIDDKVYKLYGLDESEISKVENTIIAP